MIDIAWTEILFIALIALIFLGPQELPPVLRWIGKRVGQLQAFSRSFYEQLDQIQDPRIPGSFHTSLSETQEHDDIQP